jgi:3-deoxy-7-phosphoheptulonate synthase
MQDPLAASEPPRMFGSSWTPDSWRARPAGQQFAWPDAAALDAAREDLRRQPPLVFAGEARQLRESLAAVADGKAFLLQAGDCAESFDAFSADTIRDKLKIILQMAVVLTHSTGVPAVKVGRIAGQFAKPRTAATETRDGVELPSFRGDMVNDFAFDAVARTPDPQRMVRSYHQSAATLNLLRAFTKGGYADLGRVHQWNLEYVATSREGRRYEAVAQEIDRALRFMAACGIDLDAEIQLHQVDFFTAHEALVLEYEEELTRRDSLTGRWYDCSAHLLWAGERTRQPGGAHVEFLSLLRAVRRSGHPVVWACDPMHGNTFVHDSGYKTRRFEDVMRELRGFFAACDAADVWPGGVHVELTGENVTECLGGTEEVLGDHLEHRYETMCDPRLNARQSLDLAFQVAELVRR